MALTTAKAPQQSPLDGMDADSIAFMAMQPPPPPVPPTPEQARENLRRMRLVNQPDLPQVAQIKEYQAAGSAGPVPLRAYRGAGTSATDVLPVQVYYHGGGWVIGDLDSHDWTCRMVANAAQCAVVSVDYRLAPEHRFPAAFDDSLAAAEWIAANAGLLRIDPERMSVGGDSAGGNLAVAVALGLRDRGKIKLRAQILTYPITDLTAAYDARFAAGVALTNGGMRAYIDAYVPDVVQRKDWRCSPLFASSLKGLPPALVILAGFDPLCAEGEAYAARLRRTGFPSLSAIFRGRCTASSRARSCCRKPTTRSRQMAALLKAVC